MSLINEALKKAERLRNEAAADSAAASLGGGGRGHLRGSNQNSGTMVLIGSGALVLVVLSVVFTVYLVNRPTKPATPARVAAATPESVTPKPSSSASASETPTPAIVMPAITPPAASGSSAVQSTTVASATNVSTAPNATPIVAVTSSLPAASAAVTATSATPTPPATAFVSGSTRPAAQTPSPAGAPTPAAVTHTEQVAIATPAASAPALAPDAPDDRVTAFVESVRVTGIRSSGAESRVLMNERVYRVNDIVERTLNVRLVTAAADSLTFADARGVTYVKRF